MRRRSALVIAAWASAFAWVGCNALLGIESAVFEPDGGVTSVAETGGSNEEGGLSDGASSDAAAEAAAHPCTTTVTDPFNCGACGHDCLGGGCSAGRCEPVVIANEPGQPMAITVDATHVFWTNATTGDVRRAPLSGGVAQTLFDGPPGVDLGDGLVRSGADIYFTVGDADGGVFRCPATGCGAAGPVPVVAPLASPQYVGIADGGVLLFSEGTFSGRVGRCTLPCASAPEFVATAEGFPKFVAADDGSVYWSTLVPGGGNLRSGVGVPTTLVSGQAVQQVEVNGGEVLFAARGSGVKGVPTAGGTPRRLYEPLTQTERFAIDGTLVYFNDSTSSGRILRCPLVGCGDGGVTIAAGQARPYALAVDKTSIYWTNFGDGNAGTIVRLAK